MNVFLEKSVTPPEGIIATNELLFVQYDRKIDALRIRDTVIHAYTVSFKKKISSLLVVGDYIYTLMEDEKIVVRLAKDGSIVAEKDSVSGRLVSDKEFIYSINSTTVVRIVLLVQSGQMSVDTSEIFVFSRVMDEAYIENESHRSKSCLHYLSNRHLYRRDLALDSEEILVSGKAIDWFCVVGKDVVQISKAERQSGVVPPSPHGSKETWDDAVDTDHFDSIQIGQYKRVFVFPILKVFWSSGCIEGRDGEDLLIILTARRIHFVARDLEEIGSIPLSTPIKSMTVSNDRLFAILDGQVVWWCISDHVTSLRRRMDFLIKARAPTDLLKCSLWPSTNKDSRLAFCFGIARVVEQRWREIRALLPSGGDKAVDHFKSILFHFAGLAQIQPDCTQGYSPVEKTVVIAQTVDSLHWLQAVVAPLFLGSSVVLVIQNGFMAAIARWFESIIEAVVPGRNMFIVHCLDLDENNIVPFLPSFGDQSCGCVSVISTTDLGRRIREYTAGSTARLNLFLSANSVYLVFEAACIEAFVRDIERAFQEGLEHGNRLFVAEAIFEDVVERLKRTVEALPVQSLSQKVVSLLRRAEDQGALVWPSLDSPASGYIVTSVEPANEICQLPSLTNVLVVMSFPSCPHTAVKLANQSKYGNSAFTYSLNISEALEVAWKLRTSNVWINCCDSYWSPSISIGGLKETGFGRIGGLETFWTAYQKKTVLPETNVPVDMSGNVLFDQVREQFEKGIYGQPEMVAIDPSRDIDHTPKIFINGKQKRADRQYVYNVYTPSGKILEQVCDCGKKDIRDAVESAEQHKLCWRRRSASNRAQILFYVAENLDARRNEFIRRLEVVTGSSRSQCEAEFERSVKMIFYFASYADKYGGSMKETSLEGLSDQQSYSWVSNDPIGVIGICLPDSYPLLSFVSSMAAAICRGNCVVIVPSEKYPLLATDFYEILETSDVPPGVVNIVTSGRTGHVADVMVGHEALTQLWWLVEGEKGRIGSFIVERLSASNLKRTWTSKGATREWMEDGKEWEEFLHEAVETKTVLVPFVGVNE